STSVPARRRRPRIMTVARNARATTRPCASPTRRPPRTTSWWWVSGPTAGSRCRRATDPPGLACHMDAARAPGFGRGPVVQGLGGGPPVAATKKPAGEAGFFVLPLTRGSGVEASACPRWRAGCTGKGGCAWHGRASASLDLAFLVDHVLANNGIVLLDLHLVRRVLLVLVGRIEMTGSGRRDQADLVALGSHGSVLLRSFRRGRGGRRGRHRCRSCRWCAGRQRKHAA